MCTMLYGRSKSHNRLKMNKKMVTVYIGFSFRIMVFGQNALQSDENLSANYSVNSKGLVILTKSFKTPETP